MLLAIVGEEPLLSTLNLKALLVPERGSLSTSMPKILDDVILQPLEGPMEPVKDPSLPKVPGVLKEAGKVSFEMS